MSGTPNANAVAPWVALGVIAVVFLVVGLTDVLLAWLPPRLGDADWELATVATTFNNFPVPALGLALAAASSVARTATRSLQMIAVVAGILAALCLLSALLFALAVPLALGAASDAPAHRAIFTAAVKTGVQILAYNAFFLWIARYSWLRSR